MCRNIYGVGNYRINTSRVALSAGNECYTNVLIIKNAKVALFQEQGLFHRLACQYLDGAACRQWSTVNAQLCTVGVALFYLYKVVHHIEVHLGLVAEKQRVTCRRARRYIGYSSDLNFNVGNLELHCSFVQLVLSGLVVSCVLLAFIRSACLSGTCAEYVA